MQVFSVSLYHFSPFLLTSKRLSRRMYSSPLKYTPPRFEVIRNRDMEFLQKYLEHKQYIYDACNTYSTRELTRMHDNKTQETFINSLNRLC